MKNEFILCVDLRTMFSSYDYENVKMNILVKIRSKQMFQVKNSLLKFWLAFRKNTSL
jgi:hypothetical protein